MTLRYLNLPCAMRAQFEVELGAREQDRPQYLSVKQSFIRALVLLVVEPQSIGKGTMRKRWCRRRR
jgi:hypothetical protein